MVTKELSEDWEGFVTESEKAEKEHDEYLRVYKDMTKRQESGAKIVKHLKYLSRELRNDLKNFEPNKGLNEQETARLKEIRSRLVEINSRLTEMERELPAASNGLYLSIILGSNLSVSLLNPDDRYRYKQEYENFKVTVTCVILVMFSLAYWLSFRPMDALCNFLLVWYYCTLTIRESILRVNGSRIKGWWVAHHYISCVLCGINLTWTMSNSHCYERIRPTFILLVLYIGTVQILQNKYQMGCLRRLHALGQRYSMDITVEGFMSWMFKGLTFLLPFLIGGYIIQGYCSYFLFDMYLNLEGCGEWQVIVLAVLFALITLGNFWAIILVVLRKINEVNRSDAAKSLVMKYREKNL